MHLFAHHRGAAGEAAATETRGLVMNLGWRYDLLVWIADTVILRGALRNLRQRAIDLAQLQPGESVLDVGCGTGTLALVAKAGVGPMGRVAGVDPGPRQIARARAKAARRNVPIDFQVGTIEQLPFPSHSFDVVLSTLMMHHLPDDLKRQGLDEIARALRPEGRLVIVDFKRQAAPHGRPARLGAGALGMQDLPALLLEAGYSQIESGEMRFPRLPMLAGVGFALGKQLPAGEATTTR
jgi:ubiquinone/menaquinone biosynthesis C-methylase UbiE